MARFDVHSTAPSRIVRSAIRSRALPIAARIWTFTAILASAAFVIYLTQLHERPTPPVTLAVPWPVIAAAFALAELKVVQVHFRRETHSFSLSEFPAVIGFFFLSPTDYLIAVLVGSTVAFVIGRPRLIKLVFNLVNFMLVAVVELTILYAIAEMGGAPHVRDWVAAFAATLAAAILSALTIATVITLSGGAPQFEKLPEMIQFGSMVAFANTSLALLAVSVLWVDPLLLWLLALPLIIVFLAYQAYVSEREKHERLELLYQSSRILQHSPELDSTLVALLGHARTMFRAEIAEVILYPRGTDLAALRTTSRHEGEPEVMIPIGDLRADPIHDAVVHARGPFFQATPDGAAHGQSDMVSPLRGESDLIGSLRISNRLTEGTTFTDDDLRLLETLANQAAVALENGHLEQSLAELSRLKEELRFQAYHDPLTGLANRTLFLERAEQQLDRVVPDGMPVLLFLDLDDFKVVNDTLGHAAGDRLLVDVADRLRDVLRPGDVAARLGGDEFAVLLDGPELQQAVSVADRIIDTLRAPFLVQGQEITVGASIGVAAARTGTEAAHELLRNADVAMYKAKGSGKNRVSVFEPTMHAAIVARHALSAELSRSLGRGELVVYFQPIVAIRGLVVTGFEALVRWRHPTRGLINPAEFIPLAEETGVITALGRYVLEEACRQAALWAPHAEPDRPLSIAVNLSAQQLQETDFVSELREIVDASGIDPEQLVLEMTETVMFHETAMTLARLEAIRSLGVRIAIDDFGTGYSSLGYLRRFRVDILKIAREFVAPADHTDEWAFAGAIIALGRTLGLTIVAEGIESNGQLERLRGLGCELGQGYLFGRPSDAEATFAFLADGGARRRMKVVDGPGPNDRAGDERPYLVHRAPA
ncbi:MAG TPA: EAL domain-containing protein [Candidatus Limnocylindrales bacterium]|jgi:diguanylate cyclase (GGDEF)-like protein|nr:EAL domain-containing protein [Candidatus Limnocylindrales bacterium]